MTPKLRVVSVGPMATMQDSGRFGYMRYGVVTSGPMDWIAHELVNRALDNSADAACIEVPPHGIELACEDAAIDVAVAGGAFRWTHEGRVLGTAAVVQLRPGERLRAMPGAWGTWSYVAVRGGFDVPVVLASRSTYVRLGVSGLAGRALQAGDVLPAFGVASAQEGGAIRSRLLERGDAPIRIVLGPQDDYFTPESVQTFFSQPYAVSARFDRMGYWLEGPALEHAGGFDIVSDGIALGAIQVPGSGQPVVLLADHQTTGGYPKLGAVVRADIGAFAQRRPGEAVRFTRCDVEEARRALLDVYAELELPVAVEPFGARVREDALHASNLISGVINPLSG